MQIFTEVRLYSPKEIYAVFIFVEQKHDALTTPLPDDGHTPYARVTEEMTLNDEVKQACATTVYSSFCVESLAIAKVSGLHAGAD